MDFSKLPRELIYQDRRSITDFAISDEHWVNKALFDQLISFKCIKSKEETTEKLILSIFNDAYYILTIVFLEEFPFLRMAKIKEVLRDNRFYLVSSEKECLTLSVLLCLYDVYKEKNNRYTKKLVDELNEMLSQNYYHNDYCFNIEASNYKSMSNSYQDYNPRFISQEVANSVNWATITNNFNVDQIDDIFTHLGRTNDEKIYIIKAIHNAVVKSDKRNQIQNTIDSFLDNLYKEVDENGKGLLSAYDQNQESLNLDLSIKQEFEELKKADNSHNDLSRKTNDKEHENSFESNIKIAKDRKIDVIKVLHAMCRIGLFEKKDGSKINTQKLMEVFGKLLNDDFTNYSSNLGNSKASAHERTYMTVFDELSKSARDYLKKNKN